MSIFDKQLEIARQYAITGESLDTQAFHAGIVIGMMIQSGEVTHETTLFWTGVLWAWRHGESTWDM